MFPLVSRFVINFVFVNMLVFCPAWEHISFYSHPILNLVSTVIYVVNSADKMFYSDLTPIQFYYKLICKCEIRKVLLA